METTNITNERYDEIKKSLIEHDYLTYPTMLGLIKINKDSFEKRYVILYFEGHDTRLTVDKKFFTKLAAILGISKSKMSKKVSDDYFASLLTAINAISSQTMVTLTIDTDRRMIIDITEGGASRLSNKLLLNIMEVLLNDNPNLGIEEFKYNDGNFAVKLLAGNIHEMLGIADEKHRFGLVISNSDKGTSIGDFAYRLVCSNGMMGIRTDERLSLVGNGNEDIKMLYDKISQMSDNHFIPPEFEKIIQNASEVPASFRELEFAVNAIKKKVYHEDNNVRNQLMDGAIANHFPEYLKLVQRIKAKGYDPNNLSEDQKSKIRSGIKLWDVVNELTWIGSHNTTFDVIERAKLQNEAPKLLNKIDHLDTKFYFI